MDIDGNWERIKKHRGRLADDEMRGIAEVLFNGQEEWLEKKLRSREDVALVIEFLGYMGGSGSKKAANILLKLLEAGEEVLQIAAAEALKMCSRELVVEPLADMMLKQNQGSVKAGEIILSFGDVGAGVLRNLWFGESKPATLKAQILQLLMEAKDGSLEKFIFLAFISNEDELIRSALKAVEQAQARGLWGNVVECLANPSWLIRGRAAQTLGKWGERRALDYLRDMGADPDPWVEEERQNAIELLLAGTP